MYGTAQDIPLAYRIFHIKFVISSNFFVKCNMFMISDISIVIPFINTPKTWDVRTTKESQKLWKCVPWVFMRNCYQQPCRDFLGGRLW